MQRGDTQASPLRSAKCAVYLISPTPQPHRAEEGRASAPGAHCGELASRHHTRRALLPTDSREAKAPTSESFRPLTEPCRLGTSGAPCTPSWEIDQTLHSKTWLPTRPPGRQPCRTTTKHTHSWTRCHSTHCPFQLPTGVSSGRPRHPQPSPCQHSLAAWPGKAACTGCLGPDEDGFL